MEIQRDQYISDLYLQRGTRLVSINSIRIGQRQIRDQRSWQKKENKNVE